MDPSFDKFKIIENVEFIGKSGIVMPFVNIYKCRIGDKTKIGPFVEIQKGVIIGEKCNICSHTFICRGVVVGNECFIGHGVMFTNDRFPRATTLEGNLKQEQDWKCEQTIIGNRVSIGSGSALMCGITIGDGAMIGCGSVVTKNVEANSIVVGNPARHIRYTTKMDEFLKKN